jgi:hypothetical protein
MTVYFIFGQNLFGHVMAHGVSRRLLTAEVRIRAWVRPRGICCGQSSTGTSFTTSSSVSFISIIPPFSVLICHRPIMCATSLTKQQIIMPSVLS